MEITMRPRDVRAVAHLLLEDDLFCDMVKNEVKYVLKTEFEKFRVDVQQLVKGELNALVTNAKNKR